MLDPGASNEIEKFMDRIIGHRDVFVNVAHYTIIGPPASTLSKSQ